jgi:glycine cleavage system regulatory protein
MLATFCDYTPGCSWSSLFLAMTASRNHTSSEVPTDMNTPIIFTVIAKDRPGLVETLASRIAKQGGNWEESRMCRLGGQFAGILKVTIGEAGKEALIDSLRQLESQGFQVLIHSDDTPDSATPTPLKVRVIGRDHPGIIRDISAVLVHHAANVEELHTELVSEPMSGYTLFAATIKLVLPSGMDANVLQNDLEAVASDLMVDLEFNPAIRD